MPKERLRIAFLTAIDATDKKSWSGIPHYMAKALEKECGDVYHIGAVKPRLPLFFGKAISFLAQKLAGKRYDYIHSKSLSKAYGKFFSSKLKDGSYDVIVAPASSSYIAELQTDIPIVYVSDSTFPNMLNYYPAYTNLLKSSVRQGTEIERHALAKSTLALFPSAWAANSAIKDCGAESSKVHIIPFGANIDEAPLREEVLSRKKGKVCRLLFLGVYWDRKGGSIAFEALKELLNKGIDSELTVCGCIPPPQFTHEKMKVIPFLNKNEKADYEVFQDLLMNSDFLILPSRNECFGIVFSEASAYGLTSIAADTGGISGAIKEGENGFLLPLSANGKDYASLIAEIFRDDARYYSLVKRSRELYDSSLNWDTWAKEVAILIAPLVTK